MKYSLQSLILFADAGMGSGFLVVYAAVGMGMLPAVARIIFGLKWLRTRHPSFLTSLTSPKFTIRELLMMTAMVAIFLGWLVDHSRHAIEIHYFQNRVGELYSDNMRLAEDLLKLQAPAPNPPKP